MTYKWIGLLVTLSIINDGGDRNIVHNKNTNRNTHRQQEPVAAAAIVIDAGDGCHPSFAENPILASLLALAICLVTGSFAIALAANTSANDSTAGAVVHRDNGT